MTAVLLGLLFAFIAFMWWGFRLGRRTGFFFFLPYAIFMVGVLVFILGLYYLGRDTPNYGDGMEILIYIAGTLEFLAFLLEFFLIQPKCSGCKRRLGMKRVATSDLDRYDYIGTKNNKAVSKTELQFTAYYVCKFCGTQTSQGEVETYVNE
jgi:hypothetical protein